MTDRIVKPSRWRKQHGAVERELDVIARRERAEKSRGERDEQGRPPQIVDVDGKAGDPYRGLTLLDQWERSGRITKEMRLAGNDFAEMFHRAALSPIAAADMSRVGGCPAPGKHRGSVMARDDVHAAVEALGGMGSPAGSCAWLVLGCEISLREFSARERWRGRSINDHIAAGILIGALGTLERHFGY